MVAPADPNTTRRTVLNRDRVLQAAVELADRDGIASLTMRRLAGELGVEAMTLYYHVANKDDILSGLVDSVLGDIDLPPRGAEWKVAVRRLAISAHDVLVRHPWAATLMLAPSTNSAARLRYMEAILGAFREGGFSAELTDHAFHALDSHITGFTLWEVNIQVDQDTLPDLATTFIGGLPAGQYPYLIEHIEQHLTARRPNDEGEFAFGLDLILDGLETLRGAG